MTRDEAVAALRKLADTHNHDSSAHIEADDILIEFLKTLGYEDVAAAWDAVEPKWYE